MSENGPTVSEACNPDEKEANVPESAESVPALPKMELEEFIPGKIWVKQYFIRYAGATFTARTTVVKLPNGKLWVHSPGGPLELFKEDLSRIGGEVGYLIAPGDFHHLHLPEWQLMFPNAKSYLCPGLEAKRKDLKFHAILTEGSEDEWNGEFDQIVIRGRAMSEVLFFHKFTKTMLVTDMVEFVTEEAMKKDGTDRGWGTWFWVNVLRMKNRALPAPEYRMMGFPDKEGVKTKLERVLTEWKPEKVVISHGENMNQGWDSVEKILRSCWGTILGGASVTSAPASMVTSPSPTEQPPSN